MRLSPDDGGLPTSLKERFPCSDVTAAFCEISPFSVSYQHVATSTHIRPYVGDLRLFLNSLKSLHFEMYLHKLPCLGRGQFGFATDEDLGVNRSHPEDPRLFPWPEVEPLLRVLTVPELSA